MLIVLPPSEGKHRPDSGAALDLASMSLPGLNPTRERLLKALVRLSSGSSRRASEVLGLGPRQADALSLNASLQEAPTARADRVYTGVLYEALDVATLCEDARRRADETLAVASALFGLVRPDDEIPAYRLSGGVSLPRLGPVAAVWRAHIPAALDELADGGLLIDLRSGAYTSLGKPSRELSARTAAVRVLHEHRGERKVVSHFNKATKGRIVRALLEADLSPSGVDGLHDALGDLGWTVERAGNRLDVIVAEL